MKVTIGATAAGLLLLSACGNGDGGPPSDVRELAIASVMEDEEMSRSDAECFVDVTLDHVDADDLERAIRLDEDLVEDDYITEEQLFDIIGDVFARCPDTAWRLFQEGLEEEAEDQFFEEEDARLWEECTAEAEARMDAASARIDEAFDEAMDAEDALFDDWIDGRISDEAFDAAVEEVWQEHDALQEEYDAGVRDYNECNELYGSGFEIDLIE
jgi:hypothetical protein